MTSLRLVLSCVPPKTNHHAKQIVRVGKWTRLADKPALLEAKATLDELLLPHQINQPIPAPVVLRVIWTWPWLKTHSKKFRSAGRQPHTSPPDLSNVVKSLEDRLVRLRFLEDDRGVVEVHLAKWWGDSPGIEITIQHVAGPFRHPSRADTVPVIEESTSIGAGSDHKGTETDGLPRLRQSPAPSLF